MKTVKFAQVLKFSENLVKVDKPEEERYVTVLLYGRGVIEREIKEGKVPVAFTGYKAHAGQLIISTINARNGAAGIIPPELDGAVVSKDFPLFDIDHECVDEQYLLYYLWSDSFIHKAEQNSFGATMPRLHVKPFLNMQMRLPALSEQKRRAHTLCHVESLLNTQSHLLTKLDELVKSRFIELFGDPVANDKNWPIEELDSICSAIVDCPHSTPSYTAENTGYMCIRSSIVKKNHILWDEIEYIPEHEYRQRILRKKPEKGDIIYTREGAILGIAAMIDRNCNVALGQRSMLLSPNNSICLPQFLSVAMNFDSFLRKALGGISGSASPHINVGDIKAFAIILPPIALQEQFVTFVEQTDKSKLAVKQSLEKLETLKKSLMQQYFG